MKGDWGDDARVVGRTVDWLVRGRETTNLTYDLEPLSRVQLCWFVSAVSGAPVAQLREWVSELDDDREPFEHGRCAIAAALLHDSLHTYDCETSELGAVEPRLRDGAVLLSDNAHNSAALSD